MGFVEYFWFIFNRIQLFRTLNWRNIKMLIRFRAKNGMHRVSCEPQELFGAVLEKLAPLLGGKADRGSLAVS